MSDYLKLFGEKISKEMPGFMAISIVDVKSGNLYYSKKNDQDFDLENASRFSLEIVRSQLNSNNFLKLGQTIEDITITLSNQFQFLKISDNGGYFIFLIVDASKANMAFTKALFNKHVSEISKMFNSK